MENNNKCAMKTFFLFLAIVGVSGAGCYLTINWLDERWALEWGKELQTRAQQKEALDRDRLYRDWMEELRRERNTDPLRDCDN